MKKLFLANAVVAALSTFGAIQTVAAAENPITANVTVATDYRFRGISQTLNAPALQGGFDYAHSSGLYVGNWNSNVDFGGSAVSANLEMDLYGGYKGTVGPLGYDVGAIRYYYPGALGTQAFNATAGRSLDTTEIYGGASYGPFSGKLFYTVSDGYFGFHGGSAGSDAKGTTYLDLGYSDALPFYDLSVNARVGILDVDNDLTGSDEISYNHYTLGVTKPVAGLTVGLTYHKVSGLENGTAVGGGKAFYRATDGRGDSNNLYKSALVLSVSKAF